MIIRSRPARARGLKPNIAQNRVPDKLRSRPARARGLKHRDHRAPVPRVASRPARARGLKPVKGVLDAEVIRVAPRTGAWIETSTSSQQPGHREVAPRAGAWIETHWRKLEIGNSASRPARARGLKHTARYNSVCGRLVAPRAGAWIETRWTWWRVFSPMRSRPARARGLKLRVAPRLVHGGHVAPRAGAWIETQGCAASRPWRPRRAPRGRVD